LINAWLKMPGYISANNPPGSSMSRIFHNVTAL